MDTALRIGYYIVLFVALAAIILNIILLLITIKADKPKQQDDHDYSDDYTDPTKILGGTCNWDEEKERAEKYLTAQSGKGEIMKNKENKLNGTEKQEPCMYCTDKEFMRKMQDLVQFTDENCSMEMRYCPNCGQRLEW